MTLTIELRDLLMGVAEGTRPLDAIEEWFQRHRDALRAEPSVPFKDTVQEALAHAWSFRTRHWTEAQTRAAVQAMIERLPE